MIRSSTALMVFALVLGVPSVSHALTCGETITADTTLTADLAGCGLYGLVVGADNVVLDCDGHAITAETLHSAPVAGIRLVGRSGVTVKNCRVSNFIVGIDATSSSFNTFEQNTITASDYGVSLMGSPGNEVSGNAITGSKYLNVRIENSDWNTVESNTLTDSSTGTGIGLTESGSNLLSGNTLTGNRYAGVTIYGGELNVIQNSSITGNGTSASGYGIFIANSLSNAVHHNTITGNLGFGVHLGGANASSVHHNKLFSNRLDLSSDNSSGTDLTLNYFGGALTCASKARFSGLVLAQLAPYYLDAAMTDPATGQAPNCPLSCGDLVGGNPGDVITLTQNLTSCPGIGLQVVSDDIVLDCNGRSITGSASSFAGITLTGNRGVTVKNCTMSGFASGIYATSVASTTIENNSISGSRSIGVMVYGSQSSTLRNNTVTGGASTGVTVMVSSSIALVGNTITGNSGGGVSLASADDNVINRNRLLSNQAYDLSNASSDGNDFTLNYFGGPLGCADKPRFKGVALSQLCLLYTSPSPRDS